MRFTTELAGGCIRFRILFRMWFTLYRLWDGREACIGWLTVQLSGCAISFVPVARRFVLVNSLFNPFLNRRRRAFRLERCTHEMWPEVFLG
jgi:hypothetical protein